MESEGRSLMRSLAKTGVACGLSWTGADKLLARLEHRGNMPLILCYHRVVEDFADAKDDIPQMFISRRMLERQLDWVGRRYRFASLDEIEDLLEGEKIPDRPVAAVTFDDGYADVYHNAFPLLQRKGIPGAVFVVSDLVGTRDLEIHDKLFLGLTGSFFSRSAGQRKLAPLMAQLGIRLPGLERFDNGNWNPAGIVSCLMGGLPQADLRRIVELLDEHIDAEPASLEAHRHLDWEMLAQMQRAGMIIGSHTKSHAILVNEEPKKVLDELKGSREKLEKELGAKIEHIAYPDGQFNVASVLAVAAAGYRGGYTICRHRDAAHPLLTVPRMVLWENSCLDVRGAFSPSILNCQASGLFDFVSLCKRMHRPICRENGIRFELGEGK